MLREDYGRGLRGVGGRRLPAPTGHPASTSTGVSGWVGQGASIVGPQAGEQIAFWALAISQGLSLSAVAQTVLPYPTLAEAGKRAAVSHYSGLAKNKLVRGVIAFLKLWG